VLPVTHLTAALLGAVAVSAAGPPASGADDVPAAPQAAASAAATAAFSGAHDWMFDNGPYTRDPKTGERVWQYAQGETPRRNPNAVFDSPHSPYPFAPSLYDPLWNCGPRWPYYAPGRLPVLFGPHPSYGP
jgi:hypothetical protein